jgi:hypothetical protein
MPEHLCANPRGGRRHTEVAGHPPGLQILAVGDNQKLFESDIASLCVKSRALQTS